MLAQPQRYHQNHHDKHTATTYRRRIVRIVRTQHPIYIYVCVYTRIHRGPNFSTWTMAPREQEGPQNLKRGPRLI